MIYNRNVAKGYLNHFIPEAFDYLTKKKKIEYNNQTLKTDYLLNIIHELIMRYFIYKNDTIDKEIKFPLSSVLLKKKYGQLYNYYIEYLREHQFLILASDYYAGQHSRIYKLNRDLLLYIKWVKVNDKILLKKNSKDFLKSTFLDYNKSPIPMEIRKKLVNDLYDIKIDADSALNYLKQLKKDNNISYDKYMKNTMMVENLKSDNLFFKFDEYGRMHTNFTVLKKHIRKNYLTIDGERLEEIDISNSQPLFLAVLMKQELSVNELIKPEFTRYINLVKNGLIYEELMNKCDVKDREEAKYMMFVVLFGKNGETRKYNKMFNSVFPDVFKFIRKYKSDKNSHKELSYILQNLESKFIFDKVVNHIMEVHPEIKFFTVHDSIVVPLKYKENAQKIFDYHKRNLLI